MNRRSRKRLLQPLQRTVQPQADRLQLGRQPGERKAEVEGLRINFRRFGSHALERRKSPPHHDAYDSHDADSHERRNPQQGRKQDGHNPLQLAAVLSDGHDNVIVRKLCRWFMGRSVAGHVFVLGDRQKAQENDPSRASLRQLKVRKDRRIGGSRHARVEAGKVALAECRRAQQDRAIFTPDLEVLETCTAAKLRYRPLRIVYFYVAISLQPNEAANHMGLGGQRDVELALEHAVHAGVQNRARSQQQCHQSQQQANDQFAAYGHLASPRLKNIAHAAAGLHQRRFPRNVDFLPQGANRRIDDVAHELRGAVVNVSFDVRARQPRLAAVPNTRARHIPAAPN